MQEKALLEIVRDRFRLKPGLLLMALLAISGTRAVQAQGLPPRQLPHELSNKDRGTRPAALSLPGEAVAEAVAPRIEVSTSEVRTDSPAVPGAKLALEADRGAPAGTRFHWTQIEGPPVDFGDPSRRSIEVVIPSGAERLGFVLVAARPDFVRVVRVLVPLQDESSQSSWGAQPSGKVKADAGDDQVGLVGHRVTLNSSRSRPGDGKNARWLQVSGPVVGAPQQQGPFFSFVPKSPGLYKFLLMVAGEGELSEPDEVTVLVGSPPTSNGLTMPAASGFQTVPPPAPQLTPEQVLSAALPRLSSGSKVASEVADVLEAVAHRATLYESFGMLQSELARRLDVVLPAEPASRTAWAEGVFSPLAAYTTGQLLASGLDVRQPQGLRQPLTDAQKERVRDHFERLARAFRAALATR
jgi:hypothetical protein